MKYETLIPCRNDKTDKTFAVGDIVTEKDFNKKVIKNWVKCIPPVLKQIGKISVPKEGGTNGSSD